MIKKGSGGFGGSLTIVPDAHKNKVVCITGSVISPVAQRLAEMTGCELIDGFKTRMPDDEIAVVVIDCGGTLRCCIYQQKNTTVKLNPTEASGYSAAHIVSSEYVSGVKPNNISFADGVAAPPSQSAAAPAKPSSDSGSAIKKEIMTPPKRSPGNHRAHS